MLSTLFFGDQSMFPIKINVAALAEEIVRYGRFQDLELSHSRLDIRDFATLLDAASKCRTRVTHDVRNNGIGNLNVLNRIKQTRSASKLRRLDLGGKPLCDDGSAALLAKLVEDHPELQDLGDISLRKSNTCWT
jgi:hypothetical protein